MIYNKIIVYGMLVDYKTAAICKVYKLTKEFDNFCDESSHNPGSKEETISTEEVMETTILAPWRKLLAPWSKLAMHLPGYHA